ncbi:MAG: GNAT family N-acetyltransferase [Clostridiales bacterium]|nr:MAG: GNAT family N-acetyltransferase [Clostridiales bacterium]
MEFIIKRFEEFSLRDFYEIIKIREEVFIVEQTCVYQECDGKDRKAFHLACMENGKVSAYLRILDKGVSYDEVSIGRVLVKKEYRGRGLGKKLLEKAIEFIENELNENEIRISAQEYLTDFYGSFGFETVSDMYLEDGIPHVEMLHTKNIQ